MSVTNELDHPTLPYAYNHIYSVGPIQPAQPIRLSGNPERFSPEWWAQRLSQKIVDQYDHFALLQSYYDGNQRNPSVPHGAKENFKEWQRRARTNFAQLIITAVSNKISVKGFLNATDDPDASSSNTEAWRRWRKIGAQATINDLIDTMLTLGESYALLGVDSAGESVITCESPLWFTVETDPLNPNRVLAAGKFVEDTLEGVLKFEVLLQGKNGVEKHVFAQELKPGVKRELHKYTTVAAQFDASATYNWVVRADLVNNLKVRHSREDVPAALNEIPVIPFINKDHVGEFERHLDLLDRITQTVFERSVINSEQAYRKDFFTQPAIKYEQGAPISEPAMPDKDEDDNPVDYKHLLATGPGEAAVLPPGVEHHQSQPTDIQGIMLAEKQDVISLASVTSTLVYSLLPDAANQSAGAADAAREQFVSKVLDRLERLRQPIEKLMRFIMILEGKELESDLEVIFASVTTTPLAVRADADSKVKNLSEKALLMDVWDYTENQAEKIIQERRQERMIRDAQTAIATQVSTEQTPTA